ncbi:Peptidase S10, serine carboxypeptidase [Corchorus capsularis]|uniref:Carboxypeptidase n=1 Tax=Corchorus capsularis TaxID=210143 RepID=A0A1R3G5U4_COCAP|nr:Peptidase S10, serine carboxypeptidase [Corchorus capsularis]
MGSIIVTPSPSLAMACLFLSLLIAGIIKASGTGTYLRAQECDRVMNLPGQPSTPSISQFSGYITVNEEHGRALFYWFFEAQSQPSQKPLLLWLNGGPGCSSIAYGAASELGPLRVGKNGEALHFNQYSWTKVANLLFVESPVGVGFSYTNTSSDLTNFDDAFVAEDSYSFLVNWFERFPQFKTHDFFISGESYAGHYVPQLAELVFDRNKDGTQYPFINLKGFIVGNPITNDWHDYTGIVDYAWSHSVIPDQLYHEIKQVCDFKPLIWSDHCNDLVDQLFGNYSDIDIYDIYAPKCVSNRTSSSSSVSKVNIYSMQRMRIRGGYDPCYSDNAQDYFNRADVQASLHANTRGGKYQSCSDSVLMRYNFSVLSVLPIYHKLIKGNLKIWIYSGDTDGRVPVISSRYCVEALKLPLKSPWRSWFHKHQVGGRMVEYDGLTLVTVRGAGHLVPLTKPTQALSLIRSYFSGQPLPATAI